jgi:hypothetical protein
MASDRRFNNKISMIEHEISECFNFKKELIEKNNEYHTKIIELTERYDRLKKEYKEEKNHNKEICTLNNIKTEEIYQLINDCNQKVFYFILKLNRYLKVKILFKLEIKSNKK